jgi:CRP-like cAMP-binding protein
VDSAIVQALRSAVLFKNFTDTGVQIIAAIAQKKHVPAETPLFVENMIGDGLYIIADGRIRLMVRRPQGAALPLTVLGPGESVGEAALLRSGPRLCTAIADVPSTVIEVTRRDIAMLQRTKPQACLKLMMGVVDLVGLRLSDADAEMRAFLSWQLGL